MAALLFLVAIRVVAAVPADALPSPDFVMNIVGIETPIYCAASKTDIAVYEEMYTDLTEGMAPLTQARLDGTIDEEQSLLLFEAELERAEIARIVAARRLAAYYCAHKDELPKPK